MKSFYKTPLSKVDRRDFLKTTSLSATGLILGFHMSCSKPYSEPEQEPQYFFKPNAYININDLGEVTIVAHRSEMGTGIRTSLPTVVADELEADWSRVKLVQAVGDQETYGDQNTDGSYSIRMFYMPMRKAGATARMMLEQAAANHWQVDVSECRAENHEVVHKSGDKRLGFGELAQAASELEVPKDEDVKLKDSNDFKLIGKGTSIYDLPEIVNGKAVFGLDANIEGAKVAVVARCPVAGGKVASFNAENALKVPGVVEVFELESPGFPTGFNPLGGVVVVADHTWAAIKGREALEISWENGINGSYDSADYLNNLARQAKSNGHIRREEGNIKSEFKASNEVLEATYKLPHLSHSTMEPPTALADVKNGKCTIWAPTQHPQWARESVAGALELELADVEVNVTLLGGGFGRKSKPDFVVEAALISKNIGAPVKVVWTREDDVHHDFYHACSVQHVKVGLSADNKVTAWNHHSVFPSIGGTSSNEAVEPSGQELGLGMIDFPYDIPAICIETHEAKAHTRIGWLRSVCNIQHAFAIGSMLDEVAYARSLDPVDNLLDLLGPDRKIKFDEKMEEFFNYNEPIEDFPANTERMRGVIEMVAKKSGWGKQLPEGQGMGICSHRSFLTYVACVVKVKVDGNKITIPELHYAVDCGVIVNEDRVRSQFEGGAVYALSGALKSSISFKDGKVVESNFHDYQLARMPDAPEKIFVHIVRNSEKPTGVGEPPVPPVAPALCNAIFAATGKRVRELPIKLV
ncbi:MAG: aldehyde dehydrogenase [Cyclobacteriaceae bacterium]|nr:MAG: aldehyde dehydrogenase [Cyclobacteriaceae bacterium]